MSPRFSRPSPALIVASAAFAVALGGTAYAATTIDGSTITDHSIAGQKMINDTLTGTQVNESTLGTVPNASKVGGLTVRKVYYAPATNSTTPKTILSLGGLVLKGRCAQGIVSIDTYSTVEHAHLSSQDYRAAQQGISLGLHYSDFGATTASASHFATLDEGNPWGETSFTYTQPNGTIVNGDLSFDSSNISVLQNGDGDIFNHAAACLISGFVTSTAAS